MAIYEKVSGPDDVMTFCGEEKPMGKEFCELYEFPKLVITTTNYPMLTQWVPIRIIRPDFGDASPCSRVRLLA